MSQAVAVLEPAFDITIENARFWLFTGMSAVFVATVIIELPFFWLALRGREHAWRRALVATPALHVVSYGLLLGWYGAMAGVHPSATLTVVPAADMKIAGHYTLYFLSRGGDEVMRMELNDPGTLQPVMRVPAYLPDARLVVRGTGDTGCDIYLHRGGGNIGDGPGSMLLLPAIAARAPGRGRGTEEQQGWEFRGTFDNFGATPSFAHESEWSYAVSYYAGIHGVTRTGETVTFQRGATWFDEMFIRNATHLQGDSLVFQLGSDQICIMHPESRRIALLARGKGPIVVETAVQKTPALH